MLTAKSRDCQAIHPPSATQSFVFTSYGSFSKMSSPFSVHVFNSLSCSLRPLQSGFYHWASLVAQWERIRLQCKSRRRHGFEPWVGKIPWRRKCEPTPVFLPGELHGQRSLVGSSPWGSHRVQTWLKWLRMHARDMKLFNFFEMLFSYCLTL